MTLALAIEALEALLLGSVRVTTEVYRAMDGQLRYCAGVKSSGASYMTSYGPSDGDALSRLVALVRGARG